MDVPYDWLVVDEIYMVRNAPVESGGGKVPPELWMMCANHKSSIFTVVHYNRWLESLSS